MGFTTGDLDDVDAGVAVARQMKMRDAVDVNVFGAVRLDVSADAFVARLRDIDALERRMGIRYAVKFHDPPDLAALDALSLDQSDIDSLEACRPGDCDLQLSARDIGRFRTEVHWRGPDAKGQADRLFRQIVLERLRAYRAGGFPLLGPYNDKEDAVSPVDEFRLLSAPGDLPVELPALVHHLRGYPTSGLPGATDFFYWNKGDFGAKPTARLNRVTIYPVSGPGIPAALRYIVATSQIYAEHYFSATLELRSIVDDPTEPGKRSYLLYTTKSRVPGLDGFMAMLIRPIVRSRARAGMERYLGTLKKTVESSAGR